MMNLPIRPRRNRKSANIRGLIRETSLSPEHLIYPVFVHEGTGNQPIPSLPGCTRWSVKGLVEEAKRLMDLGIRTLDLFPAIPDEKKTPDACEACNPDGLIPRTIYALKSEVPGITVMTDVALDPYNSDGHDGLVEFRSDGTMEILNDDSVEVLCRQALCHADAGADIVSPSDMMDGRVAAIREALDEHGFQNVSIMSYAVKYASGYYGPFRDAADSAPQFGDRRQYQMDPANAREALKEVDLDVMEGADIIMVKPALAYLDIVREVRDHIHHPVATYNVSGEYAMVKAAAANGWIDEKRIVLETLTSMKRAGADIIITYHAMDAARWLKEEE